MRVVLDRFRDIETGQNLIGTEAGQTAIARLQKLFLVPVEESLVIASRDQRTVFDKLSELAATDFPETRTKLTRAHSDLKLEPLHMRTYSLETSNGPREIELPIGTRFVNARTLKAMFDARPSDPLLRKVGRSWMICADSFRIDVTDTGEVFRVGKIQIFS